jgi:hypothetical protein
MSKIPFEDDAVLRADLAASMRRPMDRRTGRGGSGFSRTGSTVVLLTVLQV